MPMHSSQTLYDELDKTHTMINRQIEAAIKDAEKTIELLPYPGETTVYDLKDRNGRGVLVDLLAAKAQCISAMAALKAAELQQKAAVMTKRSGR